MNKYEIITGLASDLNPVIKCTPAMYDQLLEECRAVILDFVGDGTNIEKEKKAKEFGKKYPAICILSQHPKMKELSPSIKDEINAKKVERKAKDIFNRVINKKK